MEDHGWIIIYHSMGREGVLVAVYDTRKLYEKSPTEAPRQTLRQLVCHNNRVRLVTNRQPLQPPKSRAQASRLRRACPSARDSRPVSKLSRPTSSSSPAVQQPLWTRRSKAWRLWAKNLGQKISSPESVRTTQCQGERNILPIRLRTPGNLNNVYI